jgi:hypothetical protein
MLSYNLGRNISALAEEINGQVLRSFYEENATLLWAQCHRLFTAVSYDFS